MNTRIAAIGLTLCLQAFPSVAQLAITEVMSESLSTDFGGPDFWELTNFGTEVVNLHGYTFNDNNVVPKPSTREAFLNLSIRPDESVVICRSNQYVPDRDHFIAWWGAENVPAGLQVRFYTDVGLNGGMGGDQLWLYDAADSLVLSVSFAETIHGRTITYDPDIGELAAFSVLDRFGALKAVLSDDIGSPGRTTGPIPLGVIESPQSQAVNGCGAAILSVRGK